MAASNQGMGMGMWDMIVDSGTWRYDVEMCDQEHTVIILYLGRLEESIKGF